MWREIYRNYRRYGRADHGNAMPLGITALLLTMTAQQAIQVINDPARAASWGLLGLGVICTAFAVARALRTRRRAASS
jgi:tellurite resistance protein TehA-like permease